MMMFFASMVPPALLTAQAPTLQEQLVAQYKPVKMGSDTSGYSVVEEGTLLAIQKGGIIGIPYKDTGLSTNKYEGGVVHAPSQMAQKGFGMLKKKFGQDEPTTKLFAKGDKVYPTKIDVSLDKDTVTMGIVACDTCNKTDPPTYNKANIVFVFPKGTLAKASAGSVEDTIGTLLAISSNDQQQDQGAAQQSGDQGGQQPAQGQADSQQPAAPEQPAAEPQSIEKGMTPDQVEAALGKPDKKVNLGSKVIYVYKDLKVTFINGKVSDVQ
ncbi:MAG: hypothetical protein ABSF59_22935 [Candidatus Sulfotelmatobacter sp.]|jgi:hypothetical protein